jgi:MFS family permease
VVGPAAGGALVDAWGWRAIFLVNVPLGLAVLAGAVARLARDTSGGRRLPDPVGTLFLAAATAAVVLSLGQGSEWGWTSGSVLLPLAWGVLGVGIGLVRSAHHPAPALELDLWRDHTFTVANTASALFSVSAFAFLVSGPLFLAETWNYSELKTGLALTPGALASGFGSVITGRRARTPAARRAAAVWGSLLLAAGSFFLWAQLGTEERFVEVFLPAGLMVGVGFGLALTALFGAGATSIPPSRFASGSGMLTMTRQLGGALGVTAMAAILAASGYSAAVDAFRAVYLFCGMFALVAAVVGLGLLRPVPVAAGGADADGD